MAIKIRSKEDYDSGAFLPNLCKYWAAQDKSEVDRQRLMSYLKGLMIPARKDRESGIDREIKFLIEIAKCR